MDFRIFVAVVKIALVDARLAALARKSERLGLAPVTHSIDWGTVEDRAYFTPEGVKVRYRAVAVDVAGPDVHLDGWDFVGVVQPAASGENVLHTINNEGKAVPDRYRDRPSNVCEHCGYRRKRKQTFVLHNTTKNQWVQVGSTCLGDFFPGQTPAAVAGRAGLFADLESAVSDLESAPNLDRAPSAVHIEDYLSYVCRDIRLEGWRSRGEYRDESTADEALEAYTGALQGTEWGVLSAITEDDKRKAKAVVEFLRGDLAERARSEYERNLVALVANNAQVCLVKHVGLLASAVVCYDRAMAKQDRAASEKVNGESNHVGSVKERLTIRAKVVRQSYTEGYYGTTTVVGLRTLDGNALVWFASGVKEYDVGAVYTVTGTVKKHGEFRGEAQTILTRCKLQKAAA